MNIEFGEKYLEKMFYDAHFTGGFSQEIVKAYRKRVQYIIAALDERDFYAMKSLHYEKLKGKRRREYSMRLNQQYRLIVQIRVEQGRRTMVVLSIEDYH